MREYLRALAWEEGASNQWSGDTPLAGSVTDSLKLEQGVAVAFFPVIVVAVRRVQPPAAAVLLAVEALDLAAAVELATTLGVHSYWGDWMT